MIYRGKNCIAAAALALVAILAGAATRVDMAELFNRLALTPYASGTKPPEFAGRTLDGKTLSLTSLRGKVVILNFWASWCLECRSEMPAFEQLHREFAARGLAVVGVNARETTSGLGRFAKELRLTFPLVVDGDGEINRAYGIVGLPTTFFIARDGRAVALAVGVREWRGAATKNIIMTLLAE